MNSFGSWWWHVMMRSSKMSSFVWALLSLSLYAVVCPSSGAPEGYRCLDIVGEPSCVCRIPESNRIVNLTSLASYDGTPRFKNLVEDIEYKIYDYNPCAPFSEGDCANVHACQRPTGVTEYTDIADFGTEQIWINKGNPYLYYTGPSKREVFVELKCDPAATHPVVTTTGDRAELSHVYNFTIRSADMCSIVDYPVKCESAKGSPSCVCDTAHGTIDLTKLASFSHSPGLIGTGSGTNPEDNYFVYNPCAVFTPSLLCSNVHLCQVFSKSNSSFSLADYGSEEMVIDKNGDVYLKYSSGKEHTFKESKVHLICDQDVHDQPIFNFLGEPEVLYFDFSLTSCHACPGGCTQDSQLN